jgi:hypothetical protein
MLLAVFMVAAVTTAPSSTQADDLQGAVAAAPKDVSAYVARKANCNHFLGEEPYDKARAAELNKAMRELKCSTLDRDEARLRRRYAKAPAMLKLIDEAADLSGWAP